MTDQTETLRALSEAATPGPWHPYVAYSGESGTPDEVGIYAGAGTTHHGSENTVIADFTLYATEALPNYEFIVAAVNYVREALATPPAAGLEEAAREVAKAYLADDHKGLLGACADLCAELGIDTRADR